MSRKRLKYCLLPAFRNGLSQLMIIYNMEQSTLYNWVNQTAFTIYYYFSSWKANKSVIYHGSSIVIRLVSTIRYPSGSNAVTKLGSVTQGKGLMGSHIIYVTRNYMMGSRIIYVTRNHLIYIVA